MQITLPSGNIGDGCPTYIIAEIGSNFVDKEDAIESIRLAKAAGADAVKYQLYTHESLYGFKGNSKGTLPASWLIDLKVAAEDRGIDFLCTAFSPEEYDIVDRWVDMHKIASAESTHVRILQKVNSLGKPVMMSTGAKYPHEIEQALKYLKDVPVILCYCAASYPAKDIDLERINVYRKQFKTLVGYSDHSIDIRTIPATATRYYNACVLEKHVSFIDADTPDKPHSLNYNEFATMVKAVRGTATTTLVPQWEERPFIEQHNRRIIATKEIKKGEIIQEDRNIGIFRSLKPETHAYSPFLIDRVNGAIALKDIKKGHGIGPGDI